MTLKNVGVFLLTIYVSAWVTILEAAVTCPYPFDLVNGSCYKASHSEASWPEALKNCELHGAELAIITTMEEQKALEPYLSALPKPDFGGTSHDRRQFWIGATDIVKENDFRWVGTLSSMTYTNWYPGNPNNGGDNDYEDCLEMSMDHNWQWNDNGCDEHKRYLCEVQ